MVVRPQLMEAAVLFWEDWQRPLGPVEGRQVL